MGDLAWEILSRMFMGLFDLVNLANCDGQDSPDNQLANDWMYNLTATVSGVS